jgi:hypothetical protein
MRVLSVGEELQITTLFFGMIISGNVRTGLEQFMHGKTPLRRESKNNSVHAMNNGHMFDKIYTDLTVKRAGNR